MATTKIPDAIPASKAASKTMRSKKRAPKRPKLAPDGLPWPKGYFDREPKQTIEEATALYGVRPSEYHRGRPCYNSEEVARPEFKVEMPEEPLELQELWRKEHEEWVAQGRPGAIV